MQNGLLITGSWRDPALCPVEIVERKGLGHPDTLADGIADAVSIAYSRHCLREFGAVLHHNLDKVYVGGGHFTCGYGWSKAHAPVRVVLNGRMSGSFGGKQVDIESIQEEAARQYLSSFLPHLSPEQTVVMPNATQHTQRDRWFAPTTLADLPERQSLLANDTSLCVAHAPYTTCEKLALGLEQALWRWTDGEPASPLFTDIGQDVKVIVCRNARKAAVTINVPFLSNTVTSRENYEERVREVERYLRVKADDLVAGDSLDVLLRVNPLQSGEYRTYLLATGSCVECGEEGLVGRGNNMSGIISACRPHSMESPFGKNPVYHTGRVLGHLINNLAWAIHRKLGMPCSVYAQTVNQGALLPPEQLVVELPSLAVESSIEELVDREVIRDDYLDLILDKPATLKPVALSAKED